MLRVRCAAAISAAILLASARVSAQTADEKKEAGDHWDAGVSALKANDYEKAASEFEAADAIIPSPKALRQALSARMKAHQSARAATLAAKALARYPNDAATASAANDVLDKTAPDVQKITATCVVACTMRVGGVPIGGDAARSWTLYVDPGDVEIVAEFPSVKKKLARSIPAKAGAMRPAKFDPDDKNAVSTEPAPAVVAPPSTGDTAATPPTTDEPKSDDKDKDKTESAGWGLPPPVFFVSLASTLAVGGVTVWSGIDTKNNPGPDAVKQQCAGKGTDCPAYQEGLAHQQRTNILIGATAGAAGLTVVLALVTNWKGKKKRDSIAEPTAFVSPHDAILGARGSF